jgi:hypothetical protein
VTCNDVSVKHADTRPRREHVSLIVGFGCLDLGLGSSIRVRREVGQPLVKNNAASTRSAKITVSMFKVSDRTENLLSGRRLAVIVKLSAEPKLSNSVIPPHAT